MKMSEDERQCLSESRGGLQMSFLFLVIARVAINPGPVTSIFPVFSKAKLGQQYQ